MSFGKALLRGMGIGKARVPEQTVNYQTVTRKSVKYEKISNKHLERAMKQFKEGKLTRHGLDAVMAAYDKQRGIK